LAYSFKPDEFSGLLSSQSLDRIKVGLDIRIRVRYSVTAVYFILLFRKSKVESQLHIVFAHTLVHVVDVLGVHGFRVLYVLSILKPASVLLFVLLH
jgi:hypothetical protein